MVDVVGIISSILWSFCCCCRYWCCFWFFFVAVSFTVAPLLHIYIHPTGWWCVLYRILAPLYIRHEKVVLPSIAKYTFLYQHEVLLRVCFEQQRISITLNEQSVVLIPIHSLNVNNTIVRQTYNRVKAHCWTFLVEVFFVWKINDYCNFVKFVFSSSKYNNRIILNRWKNVLCLFSVIVRAIYVAFCFST